MIEKSHVKVRNVWCMVLGPLSPRYYFNGNIVHAESDAVAQRRQAHFNGEARLLLLLRQLEFHAFGVHFQLCQRLGQQIRLALEVNLRVLLRDTLHYVVVEEVLLRQLHPDDGYRVVRHVEANIV